MRREGRLIRRGEADDNLEGQRIESVATERFRLVSDQQHKRLSRGLNVGFPAEGQPYWRFLVFGADSCTASAGLIATPVMGEYSRFASLIVCISPVEPHRRSIRNEWHHEVPA
jgi:hypothetical protein